jgi:uncharacterized membrane protein
MMCEMTAGKWLTFLGFMLVIMMVTYNEVQNEHTAILYIKCAKVFNKQK